MRPKLYRKKQNFLKQAAGELKGKHPGLTIEKVRWIMKRVAHYMVDAFMHGYSLEVIERTFFSMMYFISHEPVNLDVNTKYIKATGCPGMYLQIMCNNFLVKKYKATYNPGIYLKRILEEKLSDPDTAFNLKQK